MADQTTPTSTDAKTTPDTKAPEAAIPIAAAPTAAAPTAATPAAALPPKPEEVAAKPPTLAEPSAQTSAPDGKLPDAKKDAGAAQVQAKKDAEDQVGFRGTIPDPTPRENYTVSGVTQGLPTPETNPEQAKAALRGR